MITCRKWKKSINMFKNVFVLSQNVRILADMKAHFELYVKKCYFHAGMKSHVLQTGMKFRGYEFDAGMKC